MNSEKRWISCFKTKETSITSIPNSVHTVSQQAYDDAASNVERDDPIITGNEDDTTVSPTPISDISLPTMSLTSEQVNQGVALINNLVQQYNVGGTSEQLIPLERH